MTYRIQYACVSHIGKCRENNQDNYICLKEYGELINEKKKHLFGGEFSCDRNGLLGVFDGLGGQAHGEVASLIAAKTASEISLSGQPAEDLRRFCTEANRKICEYASQNKISNMGTTAAILAFTKENIILCNIGDSRIYRIADNTIRQISKDHIVDIGSGRKPPLSQNLGIPETTMMIDPYLAKGAYNHDDRYVLCSDGISDLVTPEDIKNTVLKFDCRTAAEKLTEKAMINGGNDNITVIVCRIKKPLLQF